MVKTDISVENMIVNYIDSLKNKIRIEKVILFGSRARGEELKNSDIDLVVISDDFSNIDFIKRLEFLELNWEYEVPIEVLAYTSQEYDELSNQIGIVAEIKKYGKQIL